jgi:tRNA-dihydrouridine synthase
MSKVPAHWDVLPEIIKLRDKIAPSTKIVINGDIEDRAHGVKIAQQTGADGVMIGRGIFKNPYCFAQNDPWPSMDEESKIRLYQKHVELFISTWVDVKKNPHGLKKFCKVYISGFDGAAELRDKIMQANTATELLRVLED